MVKGKATSVKRWQIHIDCPAADPAFCQAGVFLQLLAPCHYSLFICPVTLPIIGFLLGLVCLIGGIFIGEATHEN